MSHRNARLTFHGRRLLVQRVREQRMPIAHVAKAMGISRQCAHRWVARFDAEGEAGLHDRSSTPHRTPTKTPGRVERRVLAARLNIDVARTGLAPSSAWLPALSGGSCVAMACRSWRSAIR